jgi:putative exporter of polyketide antibiotics
MKSSCSRAHTAQVCARPKIKDGGTGDMGALHAACWAGIFTCYLIAAIMAIITIIHHERRRPHDRN